MTAKEIMQQHVRGMVGAAKEALPNDCAMLVIVFNEGGRQELGCTINVRSAILSVLRAAAQEIVKSASRVITMGN